jgi:hypothetical protein
MQSLKGVPGLRRLVDACRLGGEGSVHMICGALVILGQVSLHGPRFFPVSIILQMLYSYVILAIF